MIDLEGLGWMATWRDANTVRMFKDGKALFDVKVEPLPLLDDGTLDVRKLGDLIEQAIEKHNASLQ